MKNYALKYKMAEITKKNGESATIIQWYIEIELNGKVVPYVLKLDYSQAEFLQALIVE